MATITCVPKYEGSYGRQESRAYLDFLGSTRDVRLKRVDLGKPGVCAGEGFFQRQRFFFRVSAAKRDCSSSAGLLFCSS